MILGSGWGAQKPTLGARINFSHPLAQNLEFCALFNEQGGAVALDGKGGTSGVFANAPVWSHRAGGGLDFPAAGNVAWAGLPDAPYTGPITLVWRGIIDTGSAFREFANKIPGGGNGSTTNPFEFRTNNAATPITVLVRAGAGVFRVWNGPAITLGAVKQYAVTSTLGTIENIPTFYIDAAAGVAGTSGGGSGAGTDTGPVTGGGAAVNIGQRPDAAVQMDGICTLFLAYSRALHGGELAQLAVTPYAIFNDPALRRHLRVAA